MISAVKWPRRSITWPRCLRAHAPRAMRQNYRPACTRRVRKSDVQLLRAWRTHPVITDEQWPTHTDIGSSNGEWSPISQRASNASIRSSSRGREGMRPVEAGNGEEER